MGAARIIQPTLAEVIEITSGRPTISRRPKVPQQHRNRIRRGGASAPPFTPSSITTATPRSWHRADAGITPGTGSGVLTWADQFANGYDITQATATKQPTIDTLSGGQAALLFVRANSQLLLLTDAAKCNALAGGSDVAYTAYIVFAKSAGGAPAQGVFWLGLSTNGLMYSGTYVTLNPGVLHHERRDGVAADTDAAQSGATMTAGSTYLLRARFLGTTCGYILNGTPLTPSIANDVGTCNFDRFSIGAAVGTTTVGSSFFDGRVAEVITYTGTPIAGEEAQLVSQYFQPRYPGVS